MSIGNEREDVSTAGRRILVVSHNLVLRERLYDLLSRNGYSVKTIDSGRRAITALRHERPNLILADVAITDCNGWGLPDRIRTFDEHLPIILLTPPREAPDAIDPRTAADVQCLLSSDASEDELLAAVRRHCTTSSLPEHVRLSGTALLVDDEPQLLETLQEFLEVRGCRVVTATSGEEALDRVSRCQPTFVVLDVKMAGMDGLAAHRRIIPELSRLLAPQGFACLEIGLGQAEAVGSLAGAAGLEVREVRRDLAGIERCVVLATA